MKTTIAIALAAFAATAGVSFAADEGRRLARNADDFSFLQMQTGAVASLSEAPGRGQPQALLQQTLEQSAMQSAAGGAVTAGAGLDRPAIDADSLQGGPRRALLSPGNGAPTEGGFAAIKAAQQGRGETGGSFANPAAGATLYHYAPQK
jgi:hypothetical protein